MDLHAKLKSVIDGIKDKSQKFQDLSNSSHRVYQKYSLGEAKGGWQAYGDAYRNLDDLAAELNSILAEMET